MAQMGKVTMVVRFQNVEFYVQSLCDLGRAMDEAAMRMGLIRPEQHATCQHSV